MYKVYYIYIIYCSKEFIEHVFPIPNNSIPLIKIYTKMQLPFLYSFQYTIVSKYIFTIVN